MNKLKYVSRLPGDAIKLLKHKAYEYSITKNFPNICTGKKLHVYKGIGEGKKCFIVGNGPSLSIKDLEKIKNCDCFAANGIWGLFDNTEWRPKYYFIGDPDYANSIGDNINIPLKSAEAGFFVLTHFYRYPEQLKQYKNIAFYYQPIPTLYSIFGNKVLRSNRPKFSDDITHGCFSCGTITYEMLQVALYMGYTEIYLLGIDHNYKNGAHFTGCDEISSSVVPSNLSFWENGYKVVKEHALRKGVKIYNATRGGALEVFDRVDFDCLQI